MPAGLFTNCFHWSDIPCCLSHNVYLLAELTVWFLLVCFPSLALSSLYNVVLTTRFILACFQAIERKQIRHYSTAYKTDSNISRCIPTFRYFNQTIYCCNMPGRSSILSKLEEKQVFAKLRRILLRAACLPEFLSRLGFLRHPGNRRFVALFLAGYHTALCAMT